MNHRRVLVGAIVAVVLGVLLAAAIPDRWWYARDGADADRAWRDYTGIGQ